MHRFNEKCAVFGIYGKGLEAARLTYFGLYALQHRGQESSGITASDLTTLRTHKSMGLVSQVYSEEILETLVGPLAIGHNRYSTSGGSFHEHTQPVTGKKNIVALAHNGNLPVTKPLKDFLLSKGASQVMLDKMSDSGLMHFAVEYLLEEGLSIKDAVTKAFPLFTGAFSLVLMTKDKLVAVRDHYGIRPLCIGTLNGGYVIASETSALDTVNAQFLRDVEPGELLIIDETGLTSYQLEKPIPKMDIFEFVYFSRPDSLLYGKRVYQVRKNLGKELAAEYKLDADVVVPVPDSSIPAAIGYANATGIPLEFGLVKNRYIGRTFIMPDQKLRDRGVKMKLNPIEEVIRNKKVVLVDDSIVRGTTARKLIDLVRNAGAKEVHMLISCPPVRYPDFYGIDTPFQKDLIGAQMSISEIEKQITADSLHYLSYEGLIRATELPEKMFCTSCFTGEYPIDIGDNKNHIHKITY